MILEGFSRGPCDLSVEVLVPERGSQWKAVRTPKVVRTHLGTGHIGLRLGARTGCYGTCRGEGLSILIPNILCVQPKPGNSREATRSKGSRELNRSQDLQRLLVRPSQSCWVQDRVDELVQVGRSERTNRLPRVLVDRLAAPSITLVGLPGEGDTKFLT